MSNVPDEALHKIIQQVQTQLVTTSRQLNLVKAQLQGCETGKRRLDLTTAQLQEEENAPGDIAFWQGVGKMFVAKDPRDIQGQLRQKKQDIETEISNLTKKQKFLEKQVGEAQGHMRDIFSGLEQQKQQQSA